MWQGSAGASASTPDLVSGQSAYRPTATVHRVGVLGDSVGSSLMAGWNQGAYRDLRLTDQTLIGCDLIDAPTWHDGSVGAPEKQCASWRRDWPSQMRDAHDSSMIVLAGAQFLTDHMVAGRVVRAGTPAMRELIDETLDGIRGRARTARVSTITLVNLPCRQIDPAQLDPSLRFFAAQGSNDKTIDWTNSVLVQWAAAHPGVRIADLHTRLCGHGFTPTLNGVTLYHDTLHFTPQAAGMIWTWLAPIARSEASRGTAP
nr:SGNH hydrolase domain-containing protein [Flexivirga oryzae]